MKLSYVLPKRAETPKMSVGRLGWTELSSPIQGATMPPILPETEVDINN